MTATEPHPTPPHLTTFVAMHRGMRRDARRLVDRIERGTTAAQAPALATWWADVHRTIVHHHLAEDEVVWPHLLDRHPAFAAPAGALEADHQELDRTLDALDLQLRRLADGTITDDRAAVAARRAETLLVDHLDREEDAAFGLLGSWTPEQYAAMERRIMDRARLRDAAFGLPWLLDGLDAEATATIVDGLPIAFRALVRLRWQDRYQRRLAFTGLADPVGGGAAAA